MAVQLKRQAVGSLSITPLIDVVFLLLIFFLVATRFAEEEREIEIELPTASQALPLTAEPLEMFINIDSEGRYFIEGEFRQQEQTVAVVLKRITTEQSHPPPVSQEQQIQAVTGVKSSSNIVIALILVLVLAGIVGGIVFFLVKSSIR